MVFFVYTGFHCEKINGKVVKNHGKEEVFQKSRNKLKNSEIVSQFEA